MIDLNLMKQVTDLADWFMALPTKLVEAVMAPRKAFLDAKEKIAKLEELAALREVGGYVQSLYWFKGNIYQWLNHLQVQQKVEGVEYVKGLFADAVSALTAVEEIMKRTPLSNLSLASEAALKIAEGKRTFEALATLPDADILGDRGLIDIIAAMDTIMENGSFLARLADHHRQELEGTQQ
jgi:hypothetical protein